ncbi:MAG TPA: hypothetical protein VIT68_00510 [Candidatus Gracilibacteria bacterium]
MTKDEVFQHLQTVIEREQRFKNAPLRIAINGIEATGKTTFAEAFTEFLKAQNKEAYHVGIDGFHFDKSHRYRQGRHSARGYYEDAYDEVGFRQKVLELSQKKPFSFIPFSHDLKTDQHLTPDPIPLAPNALLITDGCHLFKPIYQSHWDLKIYLKISFETALQRGIQRGIETNDPKETRESYLNRYHAASKMYIEAVQPEFLADIIIDYEDFEDPKIIKD